MGQVVTGFTVVLAQCVQILNDHVVHLKLIEPYVSYTSIKNAKEQKKMIKNYNLNLNQF